MPSIPGKTVISLTDEELVVLSGVDQAPMSLPYYESLPAPARTVAVTTALRSLLARGLVMLPEKGSPLRVVDGAVDADGLGRFPGELQPALAAVVGVRAGSPVKVCFQRRTAGGVEVLYAHLRDHLALVETLQSNGLHTFTVVEREDFPEVVRGVLLPPDTVDGSGAALAFPASGPGPDGAQIAALGEMEVITDVIVRHVGDGGAQVVHGVASGPRGTYLAVTAAGAGEDVRFEPVTVEELGTRLMAAIGDAEAAAGASPTR